MVPEGFYTLILSETLALYKSFTYLYTYLHFRLLFSAKVSTMCFDVDRRKKRCIRFVADGEMEDSGDEADNATAVSSIPLAADSTTEIFSPMPLSSSSSNPDDPLALGSRQPGGGETESEGSASSVGVGNMPALCDDGLSSMSRALNLPRLNHIASAAPSASSSSTGSLISSTIIEH